jgi:hypothetical protein
MENNQKESSRILPWEKFSIYIAAIVGFLTIILYLIEMDRRITKVETKLSYYPEPKVEIQFGGKE